MKSHTAAAGRLFDPGEHAPSGLEPIRCTHCGYRTLESVDAWDQAFDHPHDPWRCPHCSRIGFVVE